MSDASWGNPFEAGRIIGTLCTKGRALVKMEDGEYRYLQVDLPSKKDRRKGETPMIALHDVETIILGRLADQ